MRTALLIDFGSTYTKVTAIDLTEKDILYTAQAPTTVDTDIMIGLKNALGKLGIKQKFESYEVRLACRRRFKSAAPTVPLGLASASGGKRFGSGTVF
ncbi:glutamate mutase L [Patescibacteria group bacterium]|nr:glutamate mutase L [Patescibacteria group bacterium]